MSFRHLPSNSHEASTNYSGRKMRYNNAGIDKLVHDCQSAMLYAFQMDKVRVASYLTTRKLRRQLVEQIN